MSTNPKGRPRPFVLIVMDGWGFNPRQDGNAEQLIEYDTGKILTAHTTNPVPLYLIVPQLAHVKLRSDGILADVAPTILQVLGIPQPKDMTGSSLILPS